MLPSSAQIESQLCRLQVVGDSLRQRLSDELGQGLQALALGRPVLVSGPGGSGRSLVTRVLHDTADQQRNARSPLRRVAARELALGPDPSALLQEAAGGTLVLDGIEAAEQRWQSTFALELLRRATPDQDAPLRVLAVAPLGRSELLRRGLLSPRLGEQVDWEFQLDALHCRGAAIQQLAQHFLAELALRHGYERPPRFTRRALSDLRQAVESQRIESVARLRSLIEGALAEDLAAGSLPDRVSATALLPALEGDASAAEIERRRAERDKAELAGGLQEPWNEALLLALAERHAVDPALLRKFTEAVGDIARSSDPNTRSYAQMVERSRLLSRVALWLVSGARSQVEFRRFFGDKAWQTPTKSVAWSIYHDVFPDGDDGGAS